MRVTFLNLRWLSSASSTVCFNNQLRPRICSGSSSTRIWTCPNDPLTPFAMNWCRSFPRNTTVVLWIIVFMTKGYYRYQIYNVFHGCSNVEWIHERWMKRWILVRTVEMYDDYLCFYTILHSNNWCFLTMVKYWQIEWIFE